MWHPSKSILKTLMIKFAKRFVFFRYSKPAISRTPCPSFEILTIKKHVFKKAFTTKYVSVWWFCCYCLVFVENWLCMWNSDIQIEGKISLGSRQNVVLRIWKSDKNLLLLANRSTIFVACHTILYWVAAFYAKTALMLAPLKNVSYFACNMPCQIRNNGKSHRHYSR